MLVKKVGGGDWSIMPLVVIGLLNWQVSRKFTSTYLIRKWWAICVLNSFLVWHTLTLLKYFQ